MTMAYHEARHIIKHHRKMHPDLDILITDGTGNDRCCKTNSNVF